MKTLERITVFAIVAACAVALVTNRPDASGAQLLLYILLAVALGEVLARSVLWGDSPRTPETSECPAEPLDDEDDNELSYDPDTDTYYQPFPDYHRLATSEPTLTLEQAAKLLPTKPEWLGFHARPRRGRPRSA